MRNPPFFPTSLGWGVLFLFVVSLAAALSSGSSEMAMLSASAAALAFSGGLSAAFSLRGLRLKRDFLEDGERGMVLRVPLLLVNEGKSARGPKLVLERAGFAAGGWIRTPTPLVPGGGDQIVERRVVAERRGEFKLNDVYLLGRDPLGLFQRRERFELPGQTIVYPRTVRLSLEHLRSKRKVRSLSGARTMGSAGVGGEVFGVRDYRRGDPEHVVDWKHSAKQGKLIVKEFESVGLERFALLLDADAAHAVKPGQANFEFLVDAAASILRYLAGTYSETLFVAPGDGADGVTSFSGSSGAVWELCGRILAGIQPRDARFSSVLDAALSADLRGCVVFVLSMSADSAVAARLGELVDAGVEIHWIVAPVELFAVAAESAGESDFTLDSTAAELLPSVVSARTPVEKIFT